MTGFFPTIHGKQKAENLSGIVPVCSPPFLYNNAQSYYVNILYLQCTDDITN